MENYLCNHGNYGENAKIKKLKLNIDRIRYWLEGSQVLPVVNLNTILLLGGEICMVLKFLKYMSATLLFKTSYDISEVEIHSSSYAFFKKPLAYNIVKWGLTPP